MSAILGRGMSLICMRACYLYMYIYMYIYVCVCVKGCMYVHGSGVHFYEHAKAQEDMHPSRKLYAWYIHTHINSTELTPMHSQIRACIYTYVHLRTPKQSTNTKHTHIRIHIKYACIHACIRYALHVHTFALLASTSASTSSSCVEYIDTRVYMYVCL